MTTTGAESYAAFHSSDQSPAASHQTHSAVAYLFGGLASMIGLIALAILILACSYWKLSGRFVEANGDGDGNDVLEAGERTKHDPSKTYTLEEKILVIMAGEEKPTFIATPITSRASSFASHGSSSTTTTQEDDTPGGEDDHMCIDVAKIHHNP